MPESRHKTAFITPWGLFEWVRIPFGLINAPGEFQWLMEDCLHSFRDDICTPYLDDVIVFSKSFENYVDHVRQVLQRLLANGTKLKPENCKLFQKYLGQIVTSDGYRPDPSKINAATALKDSIPANVQVDLKTRKSTGTSCHIEIHCSIQIIKFLTKYNLLCL